MGDTLLVITAKNNLDALEATRDFVMTDKAETHAPVVERLRRAGAIVLGKTNMHELAFGISGWNPTFQSGPQPGVRNAYDASRAAGGSSSGTGAALGARVVLAIGLSVEAALGRLPAPAP